MNRLIFNQKEIRNKTGLDTERCLLYPHMDMDSKVSSSPMLLEKGDGSKLLLVKDIECGNFREEDLQVKVKYFKKYVTFDPVTERMPDDWLDIIKQNAIGNKIETDASIYYAAYKMLQNSFEVSVASGTPWWRAYLYEIDAKDISDQNKSSYNLCRADAERVAPRIAGHMGDFQDSRFRSLDELLTNSNLDAIIVSSPLNQQEITGLPFELFEKSEAVTLYAQKKVYVLTSEALVQPFPRLLDVFPNLREAFVSLFDNGALKFGIEENHLTCGLLRDLGLKEEQLFPVGVELRGWREVNAGEELPYYIIAAQATRYGIETAIKYAENELDKGNSVLETDVEKQLYVAYQEFVNKWKLSVRIKPYFLVLHTGTRTRRPNLPQFAPVSAETRSMKIDCGVLVIDVNGRIRGVSDLARTMTRDESVSEFYRFAEQQMLEVSIPAAISGKNGEAVYYAGTEKLIAQKDRWVKIGLLPADIDLTKSYNRDIGHVMGKQEPATLGFRQGNKVVLKNGMIGCVEYQWPYYPYAVGIEDMFLVTSQGTINITR